MSVELLRNLTLGCYAAALLFFLLAVLLFFILRIPAVVGDLTGTTARRAIEDIRQQNAGTYQPRRQPRGRKKVASEAAATVTGQYRGETEKLATSKLMLLQQEHKTEETTLLSQAGETTLLSQAGETTLLPQTEAGMHIAQGGETTSLSPADIPAWEKPAAFSVDVDLGFSESTETID